MKIIKGKSVSKGIAFGNIVFNDNNIPYVSESYSENPENELNRFFKASADAMNQLQALYEKALHIAGEEYAKIFSIHQMMLQDEDFVNAVTNIIETQMTTAEYAVYLTSQDLSAAFLEMDDELMRTKSTDVLDVSNHILNNLISGKSLQKNTSDKNQIILSDGFLPSQILNLDSEYVSAVISKKDLSKSHAAYLARKMQIPAIICEEINFDKDLSGKYAAINGFTGEIYINPDEDTVRYLKNRHKKYIRIKNMINVIKNNKSQVNNDNQIKLIALDLDGTIISNGNILSQRSIDTINKAADKGIVVSVCTGRVMGEIPESVKQIRGIQYFITSNGSSIKDSRMNNIYSDTIPVNTADKAMDILSEYRCLIDLYVDGNGYIQKEDIENLDRFNIGQGFDSVLKSTRIIVDNILEFYNNNKPDIEKINLFFANSGEREEAVFRLNQLIPPPKITYSMDNNLEINSHTCCKGQGIHFLGNKLGINMAEIMTIGDSNNDISMLESAGFSVAMGNAPESVKKFAAYITDTCENDGAALAIEKYALRV